MKMNHMAKEALLIQQKLKKVQERLKEEKVEASVGGGMVKVTANGHQEILSVVIEKEIIKPEERDMLQDLILSGVNEALKKANELQQSEMGKVIPPGFGIPGLF
jgi:DNA-binding YbaB/EbfC family protein